MINRIRQYFYLIAIVALGLVLRLYNLTAISLWHDEAFSALLIKYPWSEMMYRIGLDVHPPMYYIFLRVWYYILGNSLWSLRGFSAFFGVGLIILTYKFVKDAFNNERLALVAALLVAVNPFQISYVTEARMYTMGAFFTLLAACALLKAMNLQQSQQKFLKYYLLFVVSTVIIIYTHYYLLFSAVALGAYGLLYHWQSYRNNWRRYGWLVLSFLVIGLAYLPWLKTFLFQFRQVGGNYWIPPMNLWSIPDTLWRLVIGSYTANHLLLGLLTLVVVGVLFFVIRRIKGTVQWLLVFSVVAPFAGAILFAVLAMLRDQGSSVYLVRYFLFSSAFLIISMAVWLVEFRLRKVAQTLLIILVAANLVAFANEWQNLDVKSHPGMAGAAELLENNVEPQHKLYVGSSFEFFNLKYYLSRREGPRQRPLLYSGGITDIKDMPHYAGTAILTNQDLLPNFETATKNGDTVWLLWTTGFGGSKPEVPKNWTQIDEKGFAEIRPYLGTWVIVTEYKVN